DGVQGGIRRELETARCSDRAGRSVAEAGTGGSDDLLDLPLLVETTAHTCRERTEREQRAGIGAVRLDAPARRVHSLVGVPETHDQQVHMPRAQLARERPRRVQVALAVGEENRELVLDAGAEVSSGGELAERIEVGGDAGDGPSALRRRALDADRPMENSGEDPAVAGR